LISMGVVTAWTLLTGSVMFALIRATIGLRASREEELQGLDIPEHGVPAYTHEPALAGAGS
ncbi:MAG: ammonium transporter, partial [Armatimonadota bacterium]|nr:ammonium transporter [Armatimonadota bacterium]MDW8156346.1 ammonium transporter [Armatimonadota bacterium]